MAVGKGSMARASKAAAGETPVRKAEAAKPKSSGKAPAKGRTAASNTIQAASGQVMNKIVYQKSSQILDRDAGPGETFGIGDAMPIYFY